MALRVSVGSFVTQMGLILQEERSRLGESLSQGAEIARALSACEELIFPPAALMVSISSCLPCREEPAVCEAVACNYCPRYEDKPALGLC